MIVYHGSTEIIKNSDVIHSKKYLDFGRGLYITTFENQAKKWTVRKGMRRERLQQLIFMNYLKNGIISRYYLLRKRTSQNFLNKQNKKITSIADLPEGEGEYGN